MDRRELIRLAAFSPLAVSCGARRDRELAPIRVAAQVYLPMSPLFLADELGFFKAEGLRVEIQPVKGSAQAIPLLSSGRTDAAFYAISAAVINAIARGARVRVVAGRQLVKLDCGDYGRLLGSQTAFPAGFTSVNQLRGKRVAVSNPAAITGFCLDMFLESAGMTRQDVKVVRIGHPQDAAALVNGQVEAFVSQGEESRLTGLGPRLVLGPQLAAVLPDFAYSYIYFGKRLLDGDPAEGARFLRAFFHGAREYAGGKTPRFLEKYARDNEMDVEKARAACRGNTAFDGAIQLADLQRFIDWCVKHKHSETRVEAANVVDSRFVQLAKENHAG